MNRPLGLAEATRLLDAAPGPETTARIEEALRGRIGEKGSHLEWARLLERAGLAGMAFREYLLAVRDEPRSRDAIWALAVAYRERGESRRAIALLVRLLEDTPADLEILTEACGLLHEEGLDARAEECVERARPAGLEDARAKALLASLREEPAPPPEEESLLPSDADLVRFVSLFGGREDVHARQWRGKNGKAGYSPVEAPLTPAVARNHLLGNETIGVYPIRVDGTVTFCALDIDIEKAALEHAREDPALLDRLRSAAAKEGLALQSALAELGLPALLEDSGYKGRHLWLFLETPEAAEVAHNFGRLFLAERRRILAPGLALEFFPRQARLAKTDKGRALGNLIKLPLGIHRLSGLRCGLLDDAGEPVDAPFRVLREVDRVARSALYDAIDVLKARAEAAPAEGPAARPPEGPPAETGTPAPAWSKADFDEDLETRAILAGCPVLATLRRKAEDERRLSYTEQVVLRHTLGHLGRGPEALNYLLDRCVDVGREGFLVHRLTGNPMSCPRIRQRVPEVTSRVACDCSFPLNPDRYPSPVLHLAEFEGYAPEEDWGGEANGDSVARRYAELSSQAKRIQEELAELRELLTARDAHPAPEEE